VTNSLNTGEYNRDQWTTLDSVRQACEALGATQIEQLRDRLGHYLSFRSRLDGYFIGYFLKTCQRSCFETNLSACCGFESIITFFADHVINFLLSTSDEISALHRVLLRRNDTGKCVYLGERGCVWRVRPISCAMFLCDKAKNLVFAEQPDAETLWRTFQAQEKEYTFPTKPVLFDELENFFLEKGVKSPHLYFHQSPGLLRLKSKAGL
jgi:hypothetical protein